ARSLRTIVPPAPIIQVTEPSGALTAWRALSGTFDTIAPAAPCAAPVIGAAAPGDCASALAKGTEPLDSWGAATAPRLVAVAGNSILVSLEAASAEGSRCFARRSDGPGDSVASEGLLSVASLGTFASGNRPVAKLLKARGGSVVSG